MARSYDIVKTTQDLDYLSWSESVQPSGLGGSRPKAREGVGPNAIYYKRRHPGELGRAFEDCLVELICSRFYALLSLECVPVQLVHATLGENEPAQWLIRSKSYRKLGERALPLETFHELRGLPNETPLDLCLRMGWHDQIAKMVLADYLLATRDRDASCFEVLCSREGTYRLSPCAPRAFSLTKAFPGQTWRLFATTDFNTTNYLGSSSLEENLSLVPGSVTLPRLGSRIRKSLFAGLEDIADPGFLEACWTILSRRWEHFESLRHL